MKKHYGYGLKLFFSAIILLGSIISSSRSLATEAPIYPVTPAYPYGYIIYQTLGTIMCDGSNSNFATYPVSPPILTSLQCPQPYKLSIVPIPLYFWTNTTLLISNFKISNNQVYGSITCHGHDSQHQGTNQENFILIFYCTK